MRIRALESGTPGRRRREYRRQKDSASSSFSPPARRPTRRATGISRCMPGSSNGKQIRPDAASSCVRCRRRCSFSRASYWVRNCCTPASPKCARMSASKSWGKASRGWSDTEIGAMSADGLFIVLHANPQRRPAGIGSRMLNRDMVRAFPATPRHAGGWACQDFPSSPSFSIAVVS